MRVSGTIMMESIIELLQCIECVLLQTTDRDTKHIMDAGSASAI
jgi:hypothetical protein